MKEPIEGNHILSMQRESDHGDQVLGILHKKNLTRIILTHKFGLLFDVFQT